MTGVQLRDQRGEGLMVGLFLTLTITALTVGALTMGFLFDQVGLGGTLLVAGGLMCAVALKFGVAGVNEAELTPIPPPPEQRSHFAPS
jgi:hypothetical protein